MTMQRIIALTLAGLFVACAHVDPDTYKKLDSTYSRDDGWYEDSSYNTHLIQNGAATGTYFDTNGSLVTAGTDDITVGDDLTVGDQINLENSEYIENGTDDMVCFVGSGGTSDETLCIDTDGTNKIELNAASSGATDFDFGAFTTLTLGNDETIKNDNNGEIELGDGTEDTAFSFGTNSVVLSSDTGVVEFDLAAVGTTLKLANDQTIVSDTDNEIQFGDGSEDTSLGFATANEVTVTTDTGVTRWDFGSIGLKTDSPMTHLESAVFCGNGPDGGTTYAGPVPLDDTEADMVFGGAGCDALDNTTEGNVDDIMTQHSMPIAITPVAMVCAGICTGATAANDTVTFILREATADNDADLTCNFAFAGDATANSCTVIDDTPSSIAASAVTAIKITNTDDDCNDAGDDFMCVVYYTY